MSGKKTAFLICGVVTFLIAVFLVVFGSNEQTYTPEEIQGSFEQTFQVNNVPFAEDGTSEDDFGNVTYYYNVGNCYLAYEIGSDGHIDFFTIGGKNRIEIELLYSLLELDNDVYIEELGDYEPEFVFEDGMIYGDIDLQ